MGMLFALPIIVALLSVIFAKSQAMLVAAWVCPFACAAIIWAVVHFQCYIDNTVGLADGFLSTPMLHSRLIWARVITGIVAYTLQMIGFVGIIVCAR
jgi:hypothetical protein